MIAPQSAWLGSIHRILRRCKHQCAWNLIELATAMWNQKSQNNDSRNRWHMVHINIFLNAEFSVYSEKTPRFPKKATCWMPESMICVCVSSFQVFQFVSSFNSSTDKVTFPSCCLLGWLCDLWRAASLADELLEAAFTQFIMICSKKLHLKWDRSTLKVWSARCRTVVMAATSVRAQGTWSSSLWPHELGAKCVYFHLTLAWQGDMTRKSASTFLT